MGLLKTQLEGRLQTATQWSHPSVKGAGWLLLGMQSPPCGMGCGVRAQPPTPPAAAAPRQDACPRPLARAAPPRMSCVPTAKAGCSTWGVHGSSVSQGQVTPTGVWPAPLILLLNTMQWVGWLLLSWIYTSLWLMTRTAWPCASCPFHGWPAEFRQHNGFYFFVRWTLHEDA